MPWGSILPAQASRYDSLFCALVHFASPCVCTLPTLFDVPSSPPFVVDFVVSPQVSFWVIYILMEVLSSCIYGMR